MELFVSKVNYVYDGETFRVDIEGLHPLIGDNIPIRVAGVDTPEIRGKYPDEKELVIKVRDFVREKLSNAQVIELRNPERGKYFRIVAEVYIDGVDIATLLLAEKLAYAYQGGKKQSYCS